MKAQGRLWWLLRLPGVLHGVLGVGRVQAGWALSGSGCLYRRGLRRCC